MYIIIIFLTAGLILANYEAYRNYDDNIVSNVFRHIGSTILALFFAPMLAVMVIIGASKIGMSGEGEYKKTVTHYFTNVYDNGDNFLFGSEMVDDELMYTYYRSVDPSTANLNSGVSVVKCYVHADLATVYPIADIKEPYIEVHIVEGIHNPNWFFIPSNNGYQKYDIYIPMVEQLYSKK